MTKSEERKLEHMKAIDALKLGETYEIGPFKPGPHYGEGYWESERMWLRQALTNRKYGKFRAELGTDYNGIVPPYQTAHYDIRYRKVGEEGLIRDLEERKMLVQTAQQLAQQQMMQQQQQPMEAMPNEQAAE